MFDIRAEDIELLKKYIDNFDELLATSDFWHIIDEIDDITSGLIIENGDEATPDVFQLENTRDYIYYKNIDSF